MIPEKLALTQLRWYSENEISDEVIQEIENIREAQGGRVLQSHKRRIPDYYDEFDLIRSELKVNQTSIFILKGWEAIGVAKDSQTTLTDFKKLERKLIKKRLIKDKNPGLITIENSGSRGKTQLIQIFSPWLAPIATLITIAFYDKALILAITMFILAIILTLFSFSEQIITWKKIKFEGFSEEV